MARSIAIKAQGDGQLAVPKGTIYACPTSTQAIVHSITLVNTNKSKSTFVNVNLYLQRDGSNSRRILPTDMELNGRFMAVEDTVLTLEAGDLIEGDASVASTVDYTINGVEES